MLSKFVGSSERCITILFEEARLAAKKHGFAIVMIDEIDTILQQDEDGSDPHASLRGTLQSELAGLKKNDGIIFIGTTNK